MVPDLPANPLSIELSLNHRRFWWQTDDEDEQPEQWDVSADVSKLDICPDDLRHVGDIALVVADLTQDRNLLDSVVLGEWALEFIAETVIDPDRAKLHPELDSMISDGTPRMVIVRSIGIEESWRGHGLGAALTASALRIMAPTARLAAFRVSPLDFLNNGTTREAAEMSALRAGAMLERVGFQRWRGVHVIDLRNPSLLDARMDMLAQWWPENDTSEEGESRDDSPVTVVLGDGGRPEALKPNQGAQAPGIDEPARDDRIFLTVNLFGTDPTIQNEFLDDYRAVIERHEHATPIKWSILNAEVTFSIVLNAVVANHLVAKQVIDELEEVVRKHTDDRSDTMGTVLFTSLDNPWREIP